MKKERKLFTLDKDVVDELANVANKSQLVNYLLKTHFEKVKATMMPYKVGVEDDKLERD